MTYTEKLIHLSAAYFILCGTYICLVWMAFKQSRRDRKIERDEAERLSKTKDPEMKINS